jgi:hypothetical protein
MGAQREVTMARIDVQWPERRSERLHVRVTPGFKQRLEEAAREAGMSVSDFVVRVVTDQLDQVDSAHTGESPLFAEWLVATMGREGADMLDRMAEAEGASRQEVVSRLLGRALAGAADDPAADLAALEASFGVCPEIEVMPRGTSERGRHLAEMWQITP